MTFNSLEFLIFLPIVVAGYFLLPHRARWVWLLVASYIAYMSWNVALIFLIVATTLVSWGAGMLLGVAKKKWQRKLLLGATLAVCLGTLVYFKYFNFILSNIIGFANLFSAGLDEVTFDIILPVGISFYTFQTLSYVIDVYRGTIPPERHLGYYALFVCFFPQLVAGPIERPQDLIPQLKRRNEFSADNLFEGFKIMLFGFFHKCVVADFCGVFVDSVFSSLSAANSLAIVAAGALFVVQVYCDFAGYSEIAMGSARMMGINLTRNFDRPFSSVSIRELMRRWHISLNTWFRDYVYIPMGGSRKGKARRLFNVLFVYFLCGLWHGANWTFVLWGLYVGVFLVIEGWLRPPFRAFCRRHNIDNSKAWIRLMRQIIVFLFFIPAGLFFRAQSVGDIGLIFTRIFTCMGFGGDYFAATAGSLSMGTLDMALLALCFPCMVMLGNMCMRQDDGMLSGEELEAGRERAQYAMRASALFYGILAVALGWLILISSDGVSAFVYFQF